MAEWKEQRAAFYKIAIEQALSSPEEFQKVFPLGCNVPEEKLVQWLRGLGKAPKAFSTQRRYVNRFKVGADPEFVFSYPTGDGDRRRNARDLYLKQGIAFGADNNGRLTEIRPHPSRSTLCVCASILSTLRWLAVVKPGALEYKWMAGAWVFNDGLGGHIHFGRKRPSRTEEVAALDRIEEDLLNLGMFPIEEVQRRREGDEHGQRYGRLGDFRLQAHGYEYRTFPSWLESPALAFVAMTFGKLAVHDPEMTKWGRFALPASTLIRMKNLLSYYKNTDDDARLALLLLSKGMPKHLGMDLKPNWGITLSKGDSARLGLMETVIPLSIKPDADDVKEMFDCLLSGTPPVWRKPVPLWSPTTPPTSYKMCIDQIDTTGKKGLGELVWDLCSHAECPIMIDGVRDQGPVLLRLPKHVTDMLPPKWLNQKEIQIHNATPWCIVVTHNGTEGPGVKTVRKLLTEGVLPIWKLKDVKADSYLAWKTHVKQTSKAKPPKKYSGKIEFSSTGENNIPGLPG